MEIDSELLINIGKQLGLKNKEHIEKCWMQDKLLYYLSKKRDDLVFKGGTALFKLYGIPRFSENLDFSVKKPVTQELLKSFCEANKITLTYKKIHNSHLFKLRFKGLLTKSNTIRVDINVTDSIYFIEQKNFVSFYPDVPPFVLNVMALNEILAEKIHAIFKRTKARDLYDLFFLLRLIKITETEKKFIIKKLHDKDIRITEKQLLPKLKKKLNDYSTIWEDELKYFTLQELPDYKIIRDFVLERFESKK